MPVSLTIPADPASIRLARLVVLPAVMLVYFLVVPFREVPGTFVSAFITAKPSFFWLLFTSITFRFTASPFGSKFPKFTEVGVMDTVGFT